MPLAVPEGRPSQALQLRSGFLRSLPVFVGGFPFLIFESLSCACGILTDSSCRAIPGAISTFLPPRASSCQARISPDRSWRGGARIPYPSHLSIQCPVPSRTSWRYARIAVPARSSSPRPVRRFQRISFCSRRICCTSSSLASVISLVS